MSLPPGTAEFDTIPYFYQDHVHQKTQPENLVFLERLRALTDSYGDRAMVGEISAYPRAPEVMGEYTSGTTRLHMAYSFDMLGPKFSPQHFRSTIEAFFKAAPDGWPAWAFSNHDSPRHVSRWARHGSPEALARLSAALLLSLEGSIYIYQGEELGQTESELEFEELRDPTGITFWPDYKGRDGCRTPMVWDASPNGGFTTGTPWLPVKGPQLARNVASQGEGSVLEFYRQMIALRRSHNVLWEGRTMFIDGPEGLLTFTRGEGVLCLFNLSDQRVATNSRRHHDAPLIAEGFARSNEGVTLAPLGFALLALHDEGLL